MPSPALSAAARLPNLTKLTNPVGAGRPASVTSPNARPTPAGASAAPSSFQDILAGQMGLSESSGPLGSLANPQIAQALASAQKAVASAASTATTAVSGKAQKAVGWAKSMVGRTEWANLCERFVEEAYGTKGVFPDAAAAGQQLVTHRGASSLRTAPVGALLYFRADETNNGYGHAGIYLGNGEMISARPDSVKVERVDSPYNRERFVGWGPAPSKFPGRKTATAPPRSTPLTGQAAAVSGAPAATPAVRSVPTSGSSPSTPRPGPAPLIPPRLPR
jgi:cell wall-associated NlpC family hydrolase